MSVEVKVNGKTYQLFKQVDVSRSMDEISRQCQIVVTEQVNNEAWLTMGDKIEIFLDKIQVFSGYTETVSESIDSGSHDITYTARDSVCDIIDSTVPDLALVSTNCKTLLQLCNTCINGIGSQIKAIDTTGSIFDSTRVKASSVDTKCGEYLTEYARLVQVFINSDGQGNLYISKPSRKLQTLLLNLNKNNSNNIKSSSLDIDMTDRYYKYKVYSQLAMASDDPYEDGDTGETSLNDIFGQAIDPSIRQSRVINIKTQRALTANECSKAAKEEANIRRARSFSYNCTVAGFSANNEIWDCGVLVSLKDDKRKVYGNYLIKDVQWTYSDSGDITTMNLTYQDAYKVNELLTPIDKKESSNPYTKDDTPTISDNHAYRMSDPSLSDPKNFSGKTLFPSDKVKISGG